MDQPKPEELLAKAIAERRLVTFMLRGDPRIAEPHDYGIIDGEARLFFYQVGGESRSKPPQGWRWGRLAELFDIELLADRFLGPRPATSGRHIHWDVLIATVSPRPVSKPQEPEPPPPKSSDGDEETTEDDEEEESS